MTEWHPDNTIGAYDAKTHFSELLERVKDGKEIIITRHGSPVAKMVPVKKRATRQERAAAIRRWRKASKGLSLKGLTIRALIDDGRP